MSRKILNLCALKSHRLFGYLSFVFYKNYIMDYKFGQSDQCYNFDLIFDSVIKTLHSIPFVRHSDLKLELTLTLLP